jgi:hypothetical protein
MYHLLYNAMMNWYCVLHKIKQACWARRMKYVNWGIQKFAIIQLLRVSHKKKLLFEREVEQKTKKFPDAGNW